MGNRTLIRLAAAAAGGALAFAATAPALASETIPINDSHVPTTAQDFGEKECDGPFENIEGDQDGWHFQRGFGQSNFEDLTLTFDTPGGEVEVIIDSSDESDPSTGTGWSGFIAPAGGGGNVIHAWVVTDAGWTLTAGEATVDEAGNENQDRFNLSHTCPGVPDENGDKTPSPTPSEPGDTTPGPTDEPGNGEKPGDENGEDDDELPVTGAQVGGIVVLGVGLLAGGIAMMAVRRRRDLSSLIDG